MHFVIKMSEWDRCTKGKSSDGFLSGANGKCCLGFVAEQCGIAHSMSTKMPSDLPSKQWEKLPVWLRPTGASMAATDGLNYVAFYGPYGSGDTDLACLAADINDDRSTTDEEKIASLTALFEKNGDTVEFLP